MKIIVSLKLFLTEQLYNSSLSSSKWPVRPSSSDFWKTNLTDQVLYEVCVCVGGGMGGGGREGGGGRGVNKVTWVFTWMSTEHMFTNAWTFTPTLAHSFPILVSDILSAQYLVAFSFETSKTASLLTRRRNWGVCENNLKSSSVGSSEEDKSRFCTSHRNAGDKGTIFLSRLNKVG